MENKFKKMAGILSIIWGVLWLICQILLNIMKAQDLKLEYEMINEYINIAFLLVQLLISFSLLVYLKMSRITRKTFSDKETAIGCFGVLIGLYVSLHSDVNLISSIFVLLGGILLVCSKE